MTRHKALAIAALLVAVVVVSLLSGRFVGLWLTPDQQGRRHFERGDYIAAARAFEDPLWKGIAAYSAGDFVAATSLFASLDGARAHFYRGNSLAQRDLLDEAVVAYRRALALQGEFPAATFNLEWVSGILALRDAQYEDAGGTGGQLAADDFVIDDRGQDAVQTMAVAEARAQGLSDAQLEEMWMRRVQTTPGDFLAFKFAFQLGEEEQP